MADEVIPASGAPVAPTNVPTISTLPNVADRLSVPASALGLDTEMPSNALPKPIADTPGPTGPSARADAAPPGPTGPASATGPAAAPATGPAASPATAPAAAPATAPAEAPKVKIGDKEYTTEELEKLLAERAKQNNLPAPTPAPAAPLPPAPTPEQIAEAESTWRDNFAKQEKIAYPTTEADVEVLLGGGKEAVEFFSKKLTEVTTRAVLLARKSVYADMNPQMEAFAKRIEPLFVNHEQVERVSTEQAFLHAYPDFAPHIATAKEVAEALLATYPQHVQKMTTQQFIATVSEQTSRILQADYKKWNPSATDTWQEAAKRQAASAAAPVTAAPAAVPPPTPAPAAATAPADPWKVAPVANPPASSPAHGAPDWNKSVAKSLQD